VNTSKLTASLIVWCLPQGISRGTFSPSSLHSTRACASLSFGLLPPSSGVVRNDFAVDVRLVFYGMACAL